MYNTCFLPDRNTLADNFICCPLTPPLPPLRVHEQAVHLILWTTSLVLFQNQFTYTT